MGVDQRSRSPHETEACRLGHRPGRRRGRPGATVTTSTNIAVTPAVPAPAIAARTVTVPGAVVSEIGSNTVVAGNTTTTTTRYWVNVPQDVTRDPSFQRWQSL